jgi:hypothetical protein
LVPTGKKLCRAVQFSGQVANKDSTAVQFKNGTGGESIQTGPDGHEGIPVSGLQITQTTNANCYYQMLQKLHTNIKKKKHLGELNDDTILLDKSVCLHVVHRLQDQLNIVKG